ncbi:TPA: hypothetical protein N0F65_002825 [Lagenidium giganteum]|uniref:Non-specific serine/threonine protein kinase n=1 Tax=Lagenidium giganteum TaxID=4803 RepID=A0AAV2ZDK5_9STRA|nr:TPA: hypothetical protein N0F65_002825 [Lagenidium giganteum]
MEPMDSAGQDALVDTIRSIIGPDTDAPRDKILALLVQADNDPNKAVDLYFQQAAAEANVAEPAATSSSVDSSAVDAANSVAEPVTETAAPVEDASNDSAWTTEATELNELLGGDQKLEVLLELLDRTKNNLNSAVELYFAEQGNGAEPMEVDQEGSQGVAAIPAPVSMNTPIAPHPLSPLTPPHTPAEAINGTAANMEASADADGAQSPGTYEVAITDSKLRWRIGNVFGRAVVQWVDPEGPAARAGIHKSDVLLAIGENHLTEKNCNEHVDNLSQEHVKVPTKLRFRRSPDNHHPADGLKPNSAKESSKKTNAVVDGTSVPKQHVGFARLCHKVSTLVDAIGGESIDIKIMVDLLLLAHWNMDVAVNNFLSEQRTEPDFRHIVGHKWDFADEEKCFGVAAYEAIIPTGPLGLTVENILERTIVVDIKPGGAAEKASVKRSSWLLSVNGSSITHLTHKETLRMIESANRPLILRLVQMPPDEYKLLRKQLAMSVRQQKVERPIPEQDRMSFRVFQQKIELAIESIPRSMATALFQYLTRDEFHISVVPGKPLLDPMEELFAETAELDGEIVEEANGQEEETDADMCAERRYLINIFRSIHDNEDKGESLVIRTIRFLGLLATKCAEMKHFVDAEPEGQQNSDEQANPALRHRYMLLLSLLLHVLESLSIIENHATWDVMISSMKGIIESLTPEESTELIVPMFARLSVSPSPTARIVPAALASLVYPSMSGDVPVQLRGMLDRMMCSDDNPLVRRAVASVIGDFANAAGIASAPWTVQLLEKATADSHDLVRIFAVKSCIQLAKTLRHLYHAEPTATKETIDQSLRLLYCQMVPMVNSYSSDSSWQVRLETARTLPAFCRAFGMDYTDVFVDHFVGMVRDLTMEVKRACAESAFDLAEAVIQLAEGRSRATQSVQSEEKQEGDYDANDQDTVELEQQVSGLSLSEKAAEKPHKSTSKLVAAAQVKVVRSILPAMYGLSSDMSVAVRLGVARSLGKSLQLVDIEHYEDFIPILTQFLDDGQDPTVRACLLEEMARHCDSGSDTMTTMIIPCIKSLVSSSQWRVRVKAVHCIAALAERADKDSIPADLADACLDLLLDSVCEVRSVTCLKLPLLVGALGDDWLTKKAIPKVSACLQATFNGRQTGLLALETLATELKATGKLGDVIETVVEECTSKVANMRFRALRTLGLLVPLLDDVKTTESALEIVRQLTHSETESDPDVRETALRIEETLVQHMAARATPTGNQQDEHCVINWTCVTHQSGPDLLSRRNTMTMNGTGDGKVAVDLLHVHSPVDYSSLRNRESRLTELRSNRPSSHLDGYRGAEELASHSTKHKPDITKDGVRRFVRRHRVPLAYSLTWIMGVGVLVYLSFFAARVNHGASSSAPDFLNCRSWGYNPDQCGLWGIDCRPFESNWTAIRCPTRCTLDQAESLEVIGSGPYRADSRICRAAVHAGVIGSNGGCALMRYTGEQLDFTGSTQHGVSSTAFPSSFPKTFEFQKASSAFCTDLSWYILAWGLLALLGYAWFQHIAPHVVYALLMTWGFFYAKVIGQPTAEIDALLISLFSDVMVFWCCCFALYQAAPKASLAQWHTWTRCKRALLWCACYVVPFHILLHLNFFAYLPWLNVDISGTSRGGRVTAGSYIVLGTVVVLALVIAGVLLRRLYRERGWKRYLLAYLAVISMVLLSLGWFPSFGLHVHHTMIGALLVPLTPFASPLAIAGQSALLGLFVQGYAVWGWAAYLEKPPPSLSVAKPKSPARISNITAGSANVSWEEVPNVEGYSLRVNKVEIYRGIKMHTVVKQLQPNMTYFITVAGVAEWGTLGEEGPKANFTTSAQ